ncbi:uncharacterized protein [Euwallacea fornicatus]|uniref:uncharacterized protein n=1 Tax=Euwallacea fornicatus TaxID=995702 RepID=UPI00338F1225
MTIVQYHALVHGTNFYYGKIFANGTATGVFRDLQLGKFDAFIGYIRLTQHVKKHFEVIHPWLRDHMLYCLRKEYVNSQWMTLMKLISPQAHALLSFVMIATILIFWKYENHAISSAIYDVVLLFWGTFVRMPKRQISRLVYTCLILLQLFLSASYVSLWIAKLSDPLSGYGLFPSTVDQLFEGRLKLHYSPPERIFLVNFGEYDLLKNSQICLSFKECTEAIRKDKNSYTLLPNILVQYRQDSLLFKQLRCMQGQKWTIRCELIFVLRKNSSLNQKFLDAVLRIRAHGIHKALLNKFYKPSKAVFVKIIGNQISMKHMMPSFYIIFIGYFYGCLVLLGEWVVYLINKHANNRPFF